MGLLSFLGIGAEDIGKPLGRVVINLVPLDTSGVKESLDRAAQWQGEIDGLSEQGFAAAFARWHIRGPHTLTDKGYLIRRETYKTQKGLPFQTATLNINNADIQHTLDAMFEYRHALFGELTLPTYTFPIEYANGVQHHVALAPSGNLYIPKVSRIELENLFRQNRELVKA